MTAGPWIYAPEPGLDGSIQHLVLVPRPGRGFSYWSIEAPGEREALAVAEVPEMLALLETLIEAGDPGDPGAHVMVRVCQREAADLLRRLQTKPHERTDQGQTP